MSANPSVGAGDGKHDPGRGVIRWLIRETLGVLTVAAILFISAGRLDWVMGWAMVGLYALWTAANALILIPRHPELLAERVGRKKGAKDWDTIILSLYGLLTIAKYILAGLDLRFGWTGGMPLGLQIGALIVAAIGYALGTWAMGANAFFSQVVRIQEERGHTVARGGPYRYVRHPGYTGSIAFELATPLMLGSLWALIPGGTAALLMVIRTVLEDRTLQQELPGYPDYAQETRYRLIPFIW